LASSEHLKRAIHRLSSALTIASAYGRPESRPPYGRSPQPTPLMALR
jgi:hypothetical protein